jgi:hypothetical protein
MKITEAANFRKHSTPQGVASTQQDPTVFFPFYELLLNYYRLMISEFEIS